MDPVDACCWPICRLGNAMAALARECGLLPRPVRLPVAAEGPSQAGQEGLGRWIEATAGWLGVEVELTEMPYGEAESLLQQAGPAILELAGTDGPQILALLGGGRRSVRVLKPDLTRERFPPGAIREALCQDLDAEAAGAIDGILDTAGVPPRRRARARVALLREHLGQARVGRVWLLRPSPGASFWLQLRRDGLPGRLGILIGAHTAAYLLWLLAWYLVGRGALQGRLDRGWLLGWALLLLTLVPFRLLVTWSQGLLAIGAGVLLKRRLLYGALQLEPEEVRHLGAGQFLGRVIESERVESLALGGGFLGLVAGVELVFAAAVLAGGAGGAAAALLLLLWVALTLLMGWRYLQRRRAWSEARLGLTHDLVERMVGHRTRLAQQRQERWHDGEDQAMEQYLLRSGAMDRVGALLTALAARGSLVVGLLPLAPAFISGGSPERLAVGIGGLLLASRALQQLQAGLSAMAGAAIAWAQVAPLFHAAARAQIPGSPAVALAEPCPKDRQPLLEAHHLVFRYPARGEPVLRGCSLRIGAGDRLLLEGPSGGGKSTLASLLTGLRLPESGLLLLHGLDRRTRGPEDWRRRVVAAPQFHENHVLTAPLAFNLLMGRRWPPQAEDLREAEAICRELGLGELLRRMPAGLFQIVGETGWSLSHGERSRLYLARALLHGADLVVLDESVAALEPETLGRCLECVLARAPTLLVIAHP